MQMIAFVYCQNGLFEKEILNTWYKFLGDYTESILYDGLFLLALLTFVFMFYK